MCCMNINSWFAVGRILPTVHCATLNQQLFAVQPEPLLFNFAELISAVNCRCRTYNINS